MLKADEFAELRARYLVIWNNQGAKHQVEPYLEAGRIVGSAKPERLASKDVIERALNSVI